MTQYILICHRQELVKALQYNVTDLEKELVHCGSIQCQGYVTTGGGPGQQLEGLHHRQVRKGRQQLVREKEYLKHTFICEFLF